MEEWWVNVQWEIFNKHVCRLLSTIRVKQRIDQQSFH